MVREMHLVNTVVQILKLDKSDSANVYSLRIPDEIKLVDETEDMYLVDLTEGFYIPISKLEDKVMYCHSIEGDWVILTVPVVLCTEKKLRELESNLSLCFTVILDEILSNTDPESVSKDFFYNMNKLRLEIT